MKKNCTVLCGVQRSVDRAVKHDMARCCAQCGVGCVQKITIVIEILLEKCGLHVEDLFSVEL